MTFDIDPWAFQRWAYQTRVGSPARKAVLMVLSTMADTNTGRCQAKQETLWQACEMGETTIRGHLKALERGGFIARRAQRRADGSRRNDEYLLLAPWVAEWPDGAPVQIPLQPAEPAGCDQPADPAGCSSPTGRIEQDQPADSAAINRQPAAGHERPRRTTTRENDHVEGMSEARVRALDSGPGELSESETQALDELAALLNARGGDLTDRDRASLVAAARAAAPINPNAVARRLEAFYGSGRRGANQPITDIVALFITEIGRRTPPPAPASAGRTLEFRAPSRRKAAEPSAPAAPSSPTGLPADLEAPGRELRKSWQQIRDGLRGSTEESTWNIWLAPLELVGFTTTLVTDLDDDERPLRTVYLTTPADQVQWIQTRFARFLNDWVMSVLGEHVSVEIVTAEAAAAGTKPKGVAA